ncbi:MAG: type II secretion system protein [Parcubacteria group bacterium]|jgi:prepilin-type N-terminal cleavage/methylation domain-containing protein
MKNRKNLGFTLIELLIVIAIIGILASAILVGLSGARTKSKDTAVLSSVTSSVGAVLLCLDKKTNPANPSDDVAICGGADKWPNLADNDWAWDGSPTFAFAAGTYSYGAHNITDSAKTIKCSNLDNGRCVKVGF